jgi:BolA family transcriptional regulator, general stress-responsive regulator
MAVSIGSVQEMVEDRLNDGLSPVYLTVENESYMHSVPADAETHFRIVIVANAFEGRRQVQCHQAVYGLLNDMIGKPIHALALHTYGPDEWDSVANAPASPACMGGSAKDNEVLH